MVAELGERFPNPEKIVCEKGKKDFVKLFGEYLRVESILQNFDEFASLKTLQAIDMGAPEQVEAFVEERYLSDEELEALQGIDVPPDRKVQDCRSTYNDIRDGGGVKRPATKRRNPPSIGLMWFSNRSAEVSRD